MRTRLVPGLAFLLSFPALAWVLRTNGLAGKFAALTVATMIWWVLAVREERQTR